MHGGERPEGPPELDKKWVKLQEKMYKGYRKQLESTRPRVKEGQLQVLFGERNRLRKALDDKLPKLDDLPPELLAYRLRNIETLLNEFAPEEAMRAEYAPDTLPAELQPAVASVNASELRTPPQAPERESDAPPVPPPDAEPATPPEDLAKAADAPPVPPPDAEPAAKKPEAAKAIEPFTEEKRKILDEHYEVQRADLKKESDRGVKDILRRLNAKYKRLRQENFNLSIRNGKTQDAIEYEMGLLAELFREYGELGDYPIIRSEPVFEAPPAPVVPEGIEPPPKPPEKTREPDDEGAVTGKIDRAALRAMAEAAALRSAASAAELSASAAPELPGGNSEPAPLDFGKAKPEARNPDEPELEMAEPPKPPAESEPELEEDVFSEHDEINEGEAEHGADQEGPATPTAESYFSQFIRREFMGQVTPDMEKKEAMTKAAMVKAIGSGLASAAASWVGVKSVMDLPRLLGQEHFTDKERDRLAAEYWEAELKTEDGQTELRASKVKASIEASKYLTAEQKEKLVEQVTGIINQQENEIQRSEKQRDVAVKALFAEAVQTRIKRTTVAKELVNSALLWSGAGVVVPGARAIAYGSISAYERLQTVSKEMKEGKREGGLAKEYFINGVWETYSNLKGGDAKTKFGKARNIAGATGTIFRTLGLGYMAMEGMEYGPEMIDKMLEAANAETPEISASLDELPPLDIAPDGTGDLEDGGIEWLPAEVVAEGSPALAETGADSGADSGAPEEAEADADVVVDETTVPTKQEIAEQESRQHGREALEALGRGETEMIERGMVHNNDTIVGIAMKQIEANPKALGYTGDLADKVAVSAFAKETAIAMARGQEIIKGDIDLRLNTDAIDHLSVVIRPDGYHFVDPTTGAELTKAQMDEMTSYGRTVREVAPVDAPEAPEVTRLDGITTLDGGEVRFTYEQGEVTGYDRMGFYENVSDTEVGVARMTMSQVDVPRDQADMIARTVAADVKVLRDMADSGLGNTAEYRYLVKELTSGLRLVEAEKIADFDESSPLLKTYYDEALAFDVPTHENIPAGGGVDIMRDNLGMGSKWYLNGSRSVEFTYNSDRSISGVAFGDMYNDIQDNEAQKIHETIQKSHVMSTEQEAFARATAQYIFTLNVMEDAGLQGRPEYQFLRKDFVDYMEDEYPSIKFDEHADVYKDYLDDAKLKGFSRISGGGGSSMDVSMGSTPDAEASSVAAAAEVAPAETVEVAAEVRMPIETAAEVDAPIVIEQDPSNANVLLLKRPLVGDYGTVRFEYGPDGRVTSWDPELKYGIFAKNKAMQLVEDTRGKLDAGDLGFRPGSFIPERTGVARAHAEVARQAFELTTTEQALDDAGYAVTSPERQFLREQLRNLIKETNNQWRGKLHIGAANPDIRRSM